MRKLLTLKNTFRIHNVFKFSVAKQSETAIFSNSFLNSANVNFLEKQYASWVADPNSVPLSFSKFFVTLSGQNSQTDTVFDENVKLRLFRVWPLLMKLFV